MSRDPRPATSRSRRHLGALAVAALLAVAATPAALAAPRVPEKDAAKAAAPAPVWVQAVAGGLAALWDQIRNVFGGGQPAGGGDGVPGTGIDPDGHHVRRR